MLEIKLNGIHIQTFNNEFNGSQVLIDFINNKKVANKFRGYLEFVNNNWLFTPSNQPNPNVTKKIALILESPHKREYNYNHTNNTFTPNGPAIGTTGRNINGKLQVRSNLTSNLVSTEVYEVKLINSVQFQCSLFHYLLAYQNLSHDAKITRKVFRCLFNKLKGNLRADLLIELNRYCPDIIFNCCTSSLKPVVRTLINDYISSCQNVNRPIVLNDIHPSVW